jgi:acetylornithine aminotransferase
MIGLGRAASLFKPGMHGTTFGGNPISCAAAFAVIKEIKAKDYLALNRAKGALLRNVISPIVGVKEVRGEGLLIGIVVAELKAKEAAQGLQERGFLVNAANENVIRLAPSYLVSESQIMKFATAFNEVCEEIYRG